MDKAEYRKNAYLMIYLIGCVLSDKIPDIKIDDIAFSKLFIIAKAHSLTAITADALNKANIHDRSFEEEKYQNIRKNIVFESERQRVSTTLEEAGIWHTPLKGCVIKDMYPEMGMRQMADNDILVDHTRMADVRSIMESLGFKTEIYGSTHQDVYYKPPVSNFEMHSRLIEQRYEPFYSYLYDIRSKLIKDDDKLFGYHFLPSDFYIYFLIHEYKHFAECGTGLRNLVDTYVILKHFEEKNGTERLDWEYIKSECRKLGIAEYEENNRNLVYKIFKSDTVLSEEMLSLDERDLLDKYIFSGTYGNMEMRIQNALEMSGLNSEKGEQNNIFFKAQYVINRLKVDEQTLKEFYPLFYKNKLLRPVLYVYRLGNKVLTDKVALKSEISALIRPASDKHPIYIFKNTQGESNSFGASKSVGHRDTNYRHLLKSIAAKISKMPIGGAFKAVYDWFVLIEYQLLCLLWKTKARKQSHKERQFVVKNVTFIYKSFERQDMARRLFRSIQHFYPGAHVIIADDSSTPLLIGSKYCKVIQLPFNSGLSFGLNRALEKVKTKYTMKLDDDELLTPLSKIYDQVKFLENNNNIDLCAIQALSAPFDLEPQNMAKVYKKFSMRNAPLELLVPHWTRIGKDHIISAKVPNVFLVRTTKYKAVAYDDNIRMIDHHEFFYRAAGVLVSAMDTSAFVFHYHNWFDEHYKKFRNDTSGDAEYIRKKHGERYYK